MDKNKVLQALSILGLIMLAVAIVIPLVNVIGGGVPGETFRYIYAVGAALLLVGRLFTSNNDANARVKRLSRIEVWAALFFCAAAFFLFYEHDFLRDAIALTLAGAIIQAYVSIMKPLADR